MKRYLTVLIAIFIFTFSFTTVYAANKAVKTSITTDDSFKKIMKKAPKINKGTTVVIPKKKNACYVKFTAPKTKSYEFIFTPEFSDEQNNEEYILGYFQFQKQSYDKLKTLKLKTEGGKYIALNCGTEKVQSLMKEKKAKEYKSSRSTTIKLKKGESVYISSYFIEGISNKVIKQKYNISVK